ncbi:MAG: YdcF family protein [Rhodospirillales bacterium]|nr:YdcF family protein [Rhodospirillales bacterium]
MRKKRDHSRQRTTRNLLLVALLLAVLWTVGLFRYADMVPNRVADAATRTDAIVVLTGGSRRLGAGLELLSRGLAGKLFVSGVYQGIDVKTLLQVVKRNPRELETQISIGNATNTTGNAAETREWMTAQKYQSLRLVTAAYHMPRSLLEFRFAMPAIVLVPHPVFPDSVKQDRWWAWPGTASLMISEYNKYLLTWARHGAGRLLGKFGGGEAA